MIITKKALPRRTFLRGVGATLALPLLDAMDPSFRYKRGSSPLNIIGLGWYAPQLEFGGPLIKGR